MFNEFAADPYLKKWNKDKNSRQKLVGLFFVPLIISIPDLSFKVLDSKVKLTVQILSLQNCMPLNINAAKQLPFKEL